MTEINWNEIAQPPSAAHEVKFQMEELGRRLEAQEVQRQELRKLGGRVLMHWRRVKYGVLDYLEDNYEGGAD